MKNFLNDVDNNVSFVIFYASQLGQAKSIAEGLAEQAENFEFKSIAFELNVIKDVSDLTKANKPIVIIASTTGDGEPPENADKFWRKIRKKSLSPTVLESVKYTILGLGDTNYNNFCNCGKEFHRRFQGLGASTFYPPAWADDATGLEFVVDDWIDNLWSALESIIRPGSSKIANMTAVTVPSCPPISLNLEWLDSGDGSNIDLKNPLLPYPLIEGDPVSVRLKDAKILTKQGSLKTALELTLEFTEKPFGFQPGDAINIVCPNPANEVNQILDRLKLSEYADKTLQLSVKEGAKGKIPAFLPATITPRQAFTHYLDIRSCPKKNFVRLLGEYTSEESEKSKLLELCSRQGSAAFEETIRFSALSLLDLLLTFPSCTPPLEALLEHLPRLAPKAYSISSSPLTNDNRLTFVFNIVVFPKEKGRQYERLGVCTGWLYQKSKQLLGTEQKVGDTSEELGKAMNALQISDTAGTADADESCDILIYRRKNQTFHLPEDTSAPVIMVGPGTGVAPFVGFIQHREKLCDKASQSTGEMTLYFGCRHQSRDFLYETELKAYESKTLNKFYPVFSRDDPENPVKYVQHRMEQNKEEVVSTLFDNGGYLYVCGDARNMVKDVRETLVKCVQTVRGITETEAKTLVTELSTQKRYLQDVWT